MDVHLCMLYIHVCQSLSVELFYAFIDFLIKDINNIKIKVNMKEAELLFLFISILQK